MSNVHKATFHMTCTDEGKTYYMSLENGETFIPNGIPGWWDLNEEENLYSDGSVNVEELPAATPSSFMRRVKNYVVSMQRTLPM